MAMVMRIVLRLLLLAVGVVFVAGLVTLMLVFTAIWALRALWARLTGQAVTPWAMRVDPRAGWSRFNAPSARSDSAPRAARQRVVAEVADVVDVKVKERT
jgi:hypothetical protein